MPQLKNYFHPIKIDFVTYRIKKALLSFMLLPKFERAIAHPALILYYCSFENKIENITSKIFYDLIKARFKMTLNI